MNSHEISIQVEHAVSVYESSLGNELLVDILERYLPNSSEAWLEAATHLPSDYATSAEDLYRRAAKCVDWDNKEYINFNYSLEEFKERTSLSEREIIEILEQRAAKQDYAESVATYFEIIEYYFYTKNDIDKAMDWIIRAIKNNKYLDWHFSSMSPTDFCKYYKTENIATLCDVGTVFFLNGEIKKALEFWSTLEGKELETLPGYMLHCLFDYGIIHLRNDVEFLVEDYELNFKGDSNKNRNTF